MGGVRHEEPRARAVHLAAVLVAHQHYGGDQLGGILTAAHRRRVIGPTVRLPHRTIGGGLSAISWMSTSGGVSNTEATTTAKLSGETSRARSNSEPKPARTLRSISVAMPPG